MGWCYMAASYGFIVVLTMNLFCVVVLSQQMYILGRIMTSGALGFEMAKSLFMNSTVTRLRHVAVKSFEYSVPLFLVSSSAMVYQEINPSGDKRPEAILVCTFMAV